MSENHPRIELPQAKAPVANYVPVALAGQIAFVAGQVPAKNGEYEFIGVVGDDLTVEDGQAAARLCALNILAQLQARFGDLDSVRQILKLTVFIRSAPEFTEQPKVANGASDVLVEALGERGKHARAAIGVSQLPFGVAVEIDAVVELA